MADPVAGKLAATAGLGRPINEVNRLLEQFREMQKMMKKAASVQAGGGKIRPGMFGGMR